VLTFGQRTLPDLVRPPCISLLADIPRKVVRPIGRSERVCEGRNGAGRKVDHDQSIGT
jgi:hypothetical protein